MKYQVNIPPDVEKAVRAHLFQNELEQGAFLFAQISETEDELRVNVQDVYLIPPDGWQVQHEVYLEMTDTQRSKVMQAARVGGFAVIDCHSHPDSFGDVWFSPSDRIGISEFAAYAKWKLDNRPFTAMVWGEESVDAVIWHGDFDEPHSVDEVVITDEPSQMWMPRGTWHGQPLSYWSPDVNEQ